MVNRALTKTEVERLHRQLRASQWRAALSTYYTCYRQDFPHWMVYIGKPRGTSRDTVMQFILQGDGPDSISSVLRANNRYIWLMLFVDGRMEGDTKPQSRGALSEQTTIDTDSIVTRTTVRGVTMVVRTAPALGVSTQTATAGDTATTTITAANGTKTTLIAAPAEQLSALTPPRSVAPAKTEESDSADLKFARRVVTYQRDPVLALLIKGLAKLDPPSDQSLADSTINVQLEQVADGAVSPDSDPLYAGSARFGLIANTAVELRVSPAIGKRFPRFDGDTLPRVGGVITNLQVTKDHEVDLGMVLGATFGSRIPTYSATLQITSETARTQENGYLVGFWNFYHIKTNPLERRTFGLFAGTNIVRGSLGDELVMGVSFGSLFSHGLGLSVGASQVNAPVLANGVQRLQPSRRLLIGTDFRI